MAGRLHAQAQHGDGATAYMQIFTKTALSPGDVVFFNGCTADGIPMASNEPCSEDGAPVLGIADEHVAINVRATIIVAGIATVYTTAQLDKYGTIVYAKTLETSLPMRPIGTLIGPTAGRIVAKPTGGTAYHDGFRIFLCPWMAAFHLPCHRPTPMNTVTKTETHQTEAGGATVTITTTTKTTPLAATPDPKQINFKELFGHTGYTAFCDELWPNSTLDEEKDTAIQKMEQAAYAAVAKVDSMPWCAVQ